MIEARGTRSQRLGLAVAISTWCVVLGVGLTQHAFAATLTFDEFGNSSTGAGSLKADPGPGGLSSVMTYSLPFPGVQGDVRLTDAASGGATLDVIRFNGDGTLIFYSDNVDGADAPADTASPPGGAYTNVVAIPEVGPEGNNGAFYTPSPGQPGFDASGPTYHFISDGRFIPAAPAPTVSSTGLGFLCVILLTVGLRLLGRRYGRGPISR